MLVCSPASVGCSSGCTLVASPLQNSAQRMFACERALELRRAVNECATLLVDTYEQDEREAKSVNGLIIMIIQGSWPQSSQHQIR